MLSNHVIDSNMQNNKTSVSQSYQEQITFSQDYQIFLVKINIVKYWNQNQSQGTRLSLLIAYQNAYVNFRLS